MSLPPLTESKHPVRHRWGVTRLSVVLAVIIVVAGGALGYGFSQGQNHNSALSRVTTVSAGRFTGPWILENYSLTFHHDGRGFANWRTLVNCGTGPGHGPPPCDPLVKKVVRMSNGVSRIVYTPSDGGHATLLLTSVRGNSARGLVERSNEQSILPDGPATFRLGAHDLLYVSVSRLTLSSPFGRSPFCGAIATALSLREAASEGISCG